MKTPVTKMFVVTVATLILNSANSFSLAAETKVIKTELNAVKQFDRIEIRGNVQLFITQDQQQKVTVFDDYFTKNALTQVENGVLRITSYGSEKLAVTVNVDNIKEITAYDNTEVETLGSLHTVELSINLHNNAKAKMDVATFNLTVDINDLAALELNGTAEQQTIGVKDKATYRAENFEATNVEARVSEDAEFLARKPKTQQSSFKVDTLAASPTAKTEEDAYIWLK